MSDEDQQVSGVNWRWFAILASIIAIVGGTTYFLLPSLISKTVTDITVVKAIDAPIKVKPLDPGGEAVDHQDLLVVDILKGGNKADDQTETLRPTSPSPEPPPVAEAETAAKTILEPPLATSEGAAKAGDTAMAHRGEDAAKKLLKEKLVDWDAKAIRSELARHYPPYWQGLPTETQAVFAKLLQDITEDEIRIDLHPDDDRDATRACFVMADHPGIFARLAGALALVGANVVDARSYTTKDGWVTDAFWIQDAEGNPYDVSRLPRLRQMISKTLKGEILARDALKSRDKVKKREKVCWVR